MAEKGVCKICSRYSHGEAVCYEVIRYPAGWGTCGRGGENRGGQGNRGRGMSHGRRRESTVALISEDGQLNFAAGPGMGLGSGTASGPTTRSSNETAAQVMILACLRIRSSDYWASLMRL